MCARNSEAERGMKKKGKGDGEEEREEERRERVGRKE